MSIMAIFRQLTNQPGAKIDNDDDKILRLARVASDTCCSSTCDPRFCGYVAVVAKIKGRMAQVWIRSSVALVFYLVMRFVFKAILSDRRFFANNRIVSGFVTATREVLVRFPSLRLFGRGRFRNLQRPRTAEHNRAALRTRFG